MFFTQGERLRQIFSSKNLNRHAVGMFALPHGPPMVMLGTHPCQGREVRVKQSAIHWSSRLDVFQRDNSLITETTTCNLATKQGELSYTPDRRICMNDSNQVKAK